VRQRSEIPTQGIDIVMFCTGATNVAWACGIGSGMNPYSTIWLTIDPRHARIGTMQPPLDSVFAALADPTRRAILSMLLEDDMAVTDVADPFDMSLAAISKHLGILAAAGLITQEKRGRVKWCKLDPDALKQASVWMQGFGQFEPVNLDAFERFLERELDLPTEPEG
jgi:DNA-binding transcriptional ArsR family regulator